MSDFTSYSLSSIYMSNFNIIRQLSKIEYDKYVQAILDINTYSQENNLFQIIKMNYKEITDTIERYLSEYKNNPSVNYGKMEAIYLNINRLILNYLSSTRMYLDHTETRLKNSDINLFEIFVIFHDLK